LTGNSRSFQTHPNSSFRCSLLSPTSRKDSAGPHEHTKRTNPPPKRENPHATPLAPPAPPFPPLNPVCQKRQWQLGYGGGMQRRMKRNAEEAFDL